MIGGKRELMIEKLDCFPGGVFENRNLMMKLVVVDGMIEG